ncbi:hypothetical protein BDW75DRAFT_240083 [Aspergillus navahoensis]
MAKHKALELEFLRRKWKIAKRDWGVHLDEESEIEEHALQTCLDFIERERADIDEGTKHYSGASHWTNALTSAVRVIGVANDYGRFQLLVRLFRPPSWARCTGLIDR